MYKMKMRNWVMMRMKVIVRINHIGNYPKNSAAMEIYHRIWLYQFSKGGATETFFFAASIYNCL